MKERHERCHYVKRNIYVAIINIKTIKGSCLFENAINNQEAKMRIKSIATDVFQ